MPEMSGLDIRGFDSQTFAEFMRTEATGKLDGSGWRPLSAVLHNTGKMVWPGIVNGKPITPQQRVRNMSVDWVSRGFKGGVHIIVAPDGGIWTCWPLWKPGTHSPSFNNTHWSIEVVGDFRMEKPTQQQRDAVLSVLMAMSKAVGQWRFLQNFKLHKEDPRTSHKDCPGANLGSKQYWIDAMREKMGFPPVSAAKSVPSPVALANFPSPTEPAILDDGDHEIVSEIPDEPPATTSAKTKGTTMNFTSMFKLNSKTFWLGVGMIVAGVYKMSGADIPGIPDLELLTDIAPEDAATLIKGGLLAIFLRDALPSE